MRLYGPIMSRGSLTSLVSEFPFQHIVHKLVVLTSVGIINQILDGQNVSRRTGFDGKPTVAAHDCGDSGHNRSQEWVSVDFMLSPIINLGCGLPPGIFLLVVDPVFCTCLHARLLQSEDGLVGGFAGQEGITAEAFPVPTSCRRNRSQRALGDFQSSIVTP